MKKVVTIVLLSAIALSSCGAPVKPEETKPVAKSVKTEVVKKDNFSEQLKLIWKASPWMESPVAPLVGGVIKKINVQVGQKVKAWEVLASLDLSSSTFWASYDNANTAYNNSLNSFAFTQESTQKDLEAAKIQLDNAISAKENTYSTTEKQLSIAQTQLDNIKKARSNTINTTDESLKNANLLLTNANTNLSNFKKNSEENLNGLYESLKVSLSSSLVSIDSWMNQADIILWATQKNNYINKAYEIYLWAMNRQTKKDAESAFYAAYSAYNDFQAKEFSWDRAWIEQKTSAVLDLLNKENDLYDKMVSMMNNTIPASSLPQSQIDWFNLNIARIQWSILQAQSGLTTLKNTLNSTKTSIDTNLASLQNAVTISETQLSNIKAWNNSQLDTVSGNQTLTQTQYENTIVSVKSSRDAVDNALKIAQANYASIQAKLESQKVAAKSQLDAAKWGKDIASIQLRNTSIVALFDWVITAKNVEVWTAASPGVPAFMIGSDDQILVKLDVSSDNIWELKLGQEVKTDKQGASYTWVITLLSPAADPITKMFKAEVSFNKKPDTFKLWDYIDAYVSKENSKDKVILVPLSAVISLGQWDYSVFTVTKDSKTQSKSVKLWNQNSTEVEVTSGLNEWDKIVISWALNLQDWDLVEEIK
ncbi:MAG: efflux transporter, RND family, MFP subunit [uncultured bacterium (gcode 4)]|uniref:Efflux transporter, RND family, MFP subunit n=1 Tax=uncultured bacterium (gcode 4) TaxID=1234023 RepID=K2FDS7_9BACT|nr:MAG: efflux transporter, RND family, MFP subunit [uncultured bacterium (gcode 4)]